MVEVKDKEIVLVNQEGVAEGLADYLKTYVKLYNDSVDTYSWMKDKLNATQRNEWERTIKSLKEICLALDLGFAPVVPPRNWASGQLFQYVAPIPQHVRDWIDKAEPIFGLQRILIYDPNVEHFKRPKHTDPLAVAFVDLAEDRIFFEIGRWDIDGDLKFIDVPKDSKRITKTARSVREVVDMADTFKKMKQWDYVDDGSWKKTYIGDGSQISITTPMWKVDPYQVYYSSAAGGTFGGAGNITNGAIGASNSISDSGWKSSYMNKMLGSSSEWKS